MSDKQIFDSVLPSPAINNSNPVGNVGVDLRLYPHYTMKPEAWLFVINISVAAANVFLWSALPGGVAGDSTDDTWGLFTDRYGATKLGKLGGQQLPIGVYHFIIYDLGGFDRFYLQADAGTVTAKVVAVLEQT